VFLPPIEGCAEFPREELGEAQMENQTTVIGVDGCKKGWIAIKIVSGEFQTAGFFRGFADILANLSDARVIGVDMPIGLPEVGKLEPALFPSRHGGA
jgi:hypothetical protein